MSWKQVGNNHVREAWGCTMRVRPMGEDLFKWTTVGPHGLFTGVSDTCRSAKHMCSYTANGHSSKGFVEPKELPGTRLISKIYEFLVFWRPRRAA